MKISKILLFIGLFALGYFVCFIVSTRKANVNYKALNEAISEAKAFGDSLDLVNDSLIYANKALIDINDSLWVIDANFAQYQDSIKTSRDRYLTRLANARKASKYKPLSRSSELYDYFKKELDIDN